GKGAQPQVVMVVPNGVGSEGAATATLRTVAWHPHKASKARTPPFTDDHRLAVQAAIWHPSAGAAFAGYAPTTSAWYRQLKLTTVATTATVTRFSVTYSYDASGAVNEVTGADGAIYWQALGRDAAGQLSGALLGNGINTGSLYDQATGALLARGSGFGANGGGVQSLTYGYDALGNLKTRTDDRAALSETVSYDTLNRLTAVQQQSGAGKEFGGLPSDFAKEDESVERLR
ncbi:MAG: hypothetical protein ACRETC_11890, partial [Gammaproteobacteria bacterium]